MSAPVAGVDISLVSTGIALIYPAGQVWVTSIQSKGHRNDTIAQRAERMHKMATAIVDEIAACSEVMIESPAHGAPGGSTWDRAGLWWLVVRGLLVKGCDVHHVSPTTVKKWITGSGRAEKNTVGVHVGRLFPDVEIATDDEADALALAHIAAVRAGYPVATRAGHNADGWAAVKWAGMESGRGAA